jgi:hypothetical protein
MLKKIRAAAIARESAIAQAIEMGRPHVHLGGSAWECLYCASPLRAACECCAPPACACRLPSATPPVDRSASLR